MGVESAIESIAKIILSLIVGILAFYLLVSNESATQKKKLAEEMTSRLINFVIFVWVSKILLKFSVFIKDPMAIIAYPSNSSAVYLAVFFSTVSLVYQVKRQRIEILSYLNSIMQVFLIASFVYEFIQTVWANNSYSIGYMVLSALLLIIYLLIRTRLATHKLLIIILIGWTAGTLALALVKPIIMLFGYTIAPWFIFVISIVYLLIIIFHRKKAA